MEQKMRFGLISGLVGNTEKKLGRLWATFSSVNGAKNSLFQNVF